ncbi:MAG: class poly(R)-hydroxyalkanoic acid synthase, partial [Rhizobacter sp.]|nr:class poly(R)-hydroxyalkanoic acid synthase [Rhizobacter sp.]
MTSTKTSAKKVPPRKASPARKATLARTKAESASPATRTSALAKAAPPRAATPRTKPAKAPAGQPTEKPLALDEPHTEKASAEQSPWFKGAFEAGGLAAVIPGMPELPSMSSFTSALGAMPRVPQMPGIPGMPQMPQLPAIPGMPQIPAMPPIDLATLGQSFQTLAGLTVAPEVLTDLQSTYMKQAAAIWNQAMGIAPTEPAPPPSSDKRFAAPEWNEQPGSAFTASMYLLNARTMMRMADSLQGDVKARQRIRFAVEQFVSAASPTNSLALNPQALKLAIDTRGESLAQGMAHLVADMKQGHMSQTDESLFEVGRNVATTEGSVVFENELFQLIDYKPLTAQVYERPLLMIPPCINKFYILDLQPDNSLIRHTVEQGHRVFVLSWRNVDDRQAQVTWDVYIEDAAIAAIDKVREISGM